MKKVKPIYKKLLAIAFVMWVISISIFITEIYIKIGKIEHTLSHVSFGRCGH